MRILHLSDLHVVSDETLAFVRKFNERLAGLPFKLEIHAASRNGRDLLLQHVRRTYAQQFDAIVVTGDLTGLGDDSSMVLAGEFLEELSSAALKREASKKNVIVLPGNHDVLELTLTAFVDAVRSRAGAGINFLFRLFGGDAARIVDHFEYLLKQLRPNGAFPLGNAEVDNFRDYIRASFNVKLSNFTVPELRGPTSYLLSGYAVNGQPVDVRFHLINTLTFLPLLFSAGTISEEDAASLAFDLARDDNSVAVALTHQGLLALPYLFQSGGTGSRDVALIFEHSLASLINGYNLVRLLQARHVELHLHGHEHHNTASSFDFELSKPGALFSFGAPAGGRIGNTPFGFNVIQFEAANIVKVQPHLFQPTTTLFEPSQAQFVKLQDQVPTRQTRIARGELHRIFYEFSNDSIAFRSSQEAYAEACDELFEQSSHSLLYFGVRLQNVRRVITRCFLNGTRTRQDLFRARLKRGVDFLVTASTSLYADKGGGGKAADDKEMRREWRSFLEMVAAKLNVDIQEVNKLLRVRTTLAPLSHAGIVEYSETQDAHVKYHRALVQTVMFQRLVDDELYFEVRENITSGFLSYYAGTALNLWRLNSTKLDLEHIS